MKVKLITCLILVFLIGVGLSFPHQVIQANTLDEKQIEEFVKGNNYMPVREAIALFEEKTNKQVSLPNTLPFEPTHRFGKITENGDLQIHYMNVSNKEKQQDFIFYIIYPDTEIEQHISQEDKVITLKDGNKAFFRFNGTHLRTLAFKKNGWGYLIGGNPSQNDKYNVEGLIEIANSIP